MNSDFFYRRHAMPPKPKPIETPPADVSHQAVHGDPSQPAQRTAERTKDSVRWVRPSEVPSMVSNRYLRRVVDANAAAVRRARTLPTRSVTRVRSVSQQLRPSPVQDRDGGIGL